jgi:hypothetical protein
MAAWIPDMFFNFYLVKNYIIANNSTTAEAREKISTYLESFNPRDFYVRFTKFINK